MEDTGYVDYSDPRLQPPMEEVEEVADAPLTAELRVLLDRAGVQYVCGWHMHHTGRVLNADCVTHVETERGMLTFEEVAEDGTMWLALDERPLTPDECAAIVGVLAGGGRGDAA